MSVDQSYSIKTQHHDWSLATGDGWLSLSRHSDASIGFYWQGEFNDPRGIVGVYRQHDITTLRYCTDGRMFQRIWRKSFGDRTIARLARAFITDVLAGDA